jgi:uncharacterized protein YbjT (DUF2867 family)
MKNEKENVLVAGANGTTGKLIVELLNKSDQYTPIAMVRKQNQKDSFEKQNIKAVLADLEQESEVENAVKKIEKVIFAAGSKGKNVIGVDQEGAKKLIKAAKNSGVNKFVMLSTMGADNPSVNQELKDYLQAKQNADNYLQESGLEYSIVRPGSLTDNDSTGKIDLKKKLDNQGKITRADVAKTLVEVLESKLKQNQIFEIVQGDTIIANAVRA